MALAVVPVADVVHQRFNSPDLGLRQRLQRWLAVSIGVEVRRATGQTDRLPPVVGSMGANGVVAFFALFLAQLVEPVQQQYDLLLVAPQPFPQ